MSADAAWEFVDTNVLVYAYDRAAGARHAAAQALLRSLWSSRRGCLSIQVLQEFYVTVTQKVARPYTPREAADIIAALSAWRVHAPTAADILAAIDLQSRYRLSFWDAMIIRSANFLGCDIVWTEDLSDGQRLDRATVRDPFR